MHPGNVTSDSIYDHTTANVLRTTGAILTFLGGGFVLFSYWKFPQLRKFTVKLILHLTICDMGYAFCVGDFGGSETDHDLRCKIQGYVTGVFAQSGIAWTVAIAYTLREAVVKSRRRPCSIRVRTLPINSRMNVWIPWIGSKAWHVFLALGRAGWT